MADDQSSKNNTSIDDLVRELSKSSTSPVAPSPIPQMARPTPFSTGPGPSVRPPVSNPVPAPSVTRPPSPIQPPVSAPRPQFSTPPKPVPPPLTATLPSTAPGVKEYQSSIRTMNEDISNLKQGQKPMGIDVPRKVDQVVPVPQQVPLKPTPPPAPQFKIPSVNLGESQKTGPMAQSKTTPIFPSILKPPLAPKVGESVPAPKIYVPQEGKPAGNRNMLFMGIGALAILAGLAYWFFVLRSSAPEVVIETPTPTPTATPVQDLSTIFSNIAIQGVGVGNIDPVSDLINTINPSSGVSEISVSGGEFVKLNITSETKGQFLLGLLDFLLNPKQELIDSFGQDHMVLLYGQKEIFDLRGVVKPNAPVEKRLVFISEVKDSYSASQILLGWETTMVGDLQKLLALVVNKQKNPQFSDNNYFGSAIRFRNFPWPDRSIDYGIVTAINGKSYLVLAGSREAMFATIDKLK